MSMKNFNLQIGLANYFQIPYGYAQWEKKNHLLCLMLRMLSQISTFDSTQESTVPNKVKCYAVFADSILFLNIFLPL